MQNMTGAVTIEQIYACITEKIASYIAAIAIDVATLRYDYIFSNTYFFHFIEINEIARSTIWLHVESGHASRDECSYKTKI